MLSTIITFFEANPLALWLITTVFLYLCFEYLYRKLKKAYSEHTALLEKELAAEKDAFKSLLRDKIIASNNARKYKNQLLKKEHFEDPTPFAESLTVCRQTIEMMGRVGLFRNNIWRQHNIDSYREMIKPYMEQSITMISRKISSGLKPEEVTNVVGKIRQVKNRLLSDNSIYETIVDDLTAMCERYYEDRGIYFATGGPVPVATLPTEYVKAEIFKKTVMQVVVEAKLNKQSEEILIGVMLNLLVFPLSEFLAALNNNALETVLSQSACFYYEHRNTLAGTENNLFIPMASIIQVARLNKDRNYLADILK